jgi:hypothetical protein
MHRQQAIVVFLQKYPRARINEPLNNVQRRAAAESEMKWDPSMFAFCLKGVRAPFGQVLDHIQIRVWGFQSNETTSRKRPAVEGCYVQRKPSFVVRRLKRMWVLVRETLNNVKRGAVASSKVQGKQSFAVVQL